MGRSSSTGQQEARPASGDSICRGMDLRAYPAFRQGVQQRATLREERDPRASSANAATSVRAPINSGSRDRVSEVARSFRLRGRNKMLGMAKADH